MSDSDKEKIIDATNKLHEVFIHIAENKICNPTEYASIIASFIGKATNHMLNKLNVNNVSDRAYFLFQIQNGIHQIIASNVHRKVDD